MAKPPAPAAPHDREAIRSSAEFRAFVEAQSIEAQRRRDDRKAEISAKTQAIARSRADHDAFAQTTEREINELHELIADDEEVMAAAERALTLRPSPVLTAHETPVASALEEQQ